GWGGRRTTAAGRDRGGAGAARAGSQPAVVRVAERHMTLFTGDYLEYYLTLVSWLIHNGIWMVLVASGVFALPFLAIVLQEWLKARAEGADGGNKGVLSAARIESRVFVAIGVILFAGVPFIDVDFSTIQHDRSRSQQCQVNVPL